jgi:chemotaxis protein MotB
MAISAALGVLGLSKRRGVASAPPPLLARVTETSIVEGQQTWAINVMLPRLLLPTEDRSATSPLANYMVLFTDRPPPVNVQEECGD